MGLIRFRRFLYRLEQGTHRIWAEVSVFEADLRSLRVEEKKFKRKQLGKSLNVVLCYHFLKAELTFEKSVIG